MSQAMTRAYMMDDDDLMAEGIDPNFIGPLDAMDVEVTELCATNDWKKKRQGATVDEKRGHLQDVLNKMVLQVKQGILQPEDASRTVHGCAALLGLQLLKEVSKTTLIV